MIGGRPEAGSVERPQPGERRAEGKAPAGIDYSIVVPVYYNEGTVQTTMRALANDVVAKNPALRAEIIFVDDGSGDRSLERLLEIRREHPGLVRVIKFTRNFGQVSAIYAGYAHARGRCAVAMSADGQDPPELINDMLRAHFEEGQEIVVYTREGRDESHYRIVTSRIFYSLMRRLSFPNMPPGGFDFVLVGRRALEVLLRNQETHPFFQGQILWVGFRTKFVGYRRRQREAGQSRWTFGKKVTYLIDGMLSYSFLPIRAMSLLGIAIALLGFAYAIVVFFARLALQTPMKGWAPLMIVVLVMGGFQMLMLGIIGEYVWRTLAQVRNRDPYVIDAIYEDAG